MNKDSIKEGALVLRAVNHPFRLQIIDYLYEKEEADVTHLYVNFRVEQSVMSQHLRILRKAKVVTTTRLGKRIYYKVNNERVDDINRALDYLR